MPASDRPRFLTWSGLARLLLLATREPFKPAPVDPSVQAVTGLRVAEYQAVTNRIANWIKIQVSIAGVGIVLVVDFFKEPNKGGGLYLWIVVVAVEILIGAYYYALSEITSDSYYIESNLTESVREDIPSGKDFWGYEGYKKEAGVYKPNGMYIAMIFCIAAPYVALLYFRPWPDLEDVDYLFASISALIAYGVFSIACISVWTQKGSRNRGEEIIVSYGIWALVGILLLIPLLLLVGPRLWLNLWLLWG